jgi:hypothetical protein
MVEQLLVIGLGIGEDADSAWLLSGLAEDEPLEPTYGVTTVASGAPATSVAGHVLATITTDGSQ